MQKILQDVIDNHDEKTVVQEFEDGIFVEFTKYYSEKTGISVCGTFDDEYRYHIEYYYPFFQNDDITSEEPVTVEKHADKDSFAGACDDYRIGVTLIFYVIWPGKYLNEYYRLKDRQEEPDAKKLTLTGLVREGSILLPIEKDKEAVKVEQENTKNRMEMISAARNGDEDAMESLTMEDMDTYSMITERISTDDVFTIVDTYFMPHGIECDQYNIMGEITDMHSTVNNMTGEEILQLTLNCNDISFVVCTNRKDLMGEPAIGRRFKGVILLQGELHFT